MLNQLLSLDYRRRRALRRSRAGALQEYLRQPFPELRQPAADAPLLAVDLETTGLSPSRDRVLSVAAFRIVEGRIRLGDVLSSLVNPGRSIPAAAIKIHGILPSMVSNAPLAVDVFDEFLDYLGTDILVGYHVGFDLHFLNKIMKQRYSFPLQNLVLDTRLMCRKIVFPLPLRYKGDPDLDTVADHFGVDTFERHSAIGDALATAMIFQRIMAQLERRGRKKLKNLLSFSY